MLDQTTEQAFVKDQRRAGDYLVPIFFFGVASLAMIAWIAGIIWVFWRLIGSYFF